MRNAGKTVFVLNQFSMPTSKAGGTRHVELFGGLATWTVRIFAGARTSKGETIESDDVITAIPVTSYRGNGPDRVLNWASYTAGAFVRGVVARPKPDVVYGSSPHLGAAVAALGISKLRRVPFILEVRDLWPHILAETGILRADSRVYRALKVLEKLLYRSANYIVVLAEGSGDAIIAEGTDASKIHFIPNFGNPDDFLPSSDRTSLRDTLGFEHFTVVYAGAHGPANGLDAVVDAVAELEAEDLDVEVVLYGDGLAKPGLVASVQDRGLKGLTFRDPVPKSEIPDILAAADVGLHCLADLELFRTGVSPNKVYDYMAAGLPVLTNNPGDISEMVESAGSGVAVAPDSLASGIRELHRLDDAARAEMSERGKSFMTAQRSRTAMTERLERILDELATPGSRR